jgi:hypothetical protein
MPEKEYIEREALVKELNKAPAYFGSGDIQYGLLIAKDIAEKQPTADVAEVVRCSRCVDLKAGVDGAYCDRTKHYVRFDDFCSYGERRRCINE